MTPGARYPGRHRRERTPMRTPLLHETLRQWNIKFAPLLTEELRHRKPRRGSRWFLDEVYIEIGGKKFWLWRDVDDSGAVLDLLVQDRRDTQAATTFLGRLLMNYDVPDVIHTDKLWSSGTAIRALPLLHAVEHLHVIKAARCNTLIEQRASVVIGVVLPKTLPPAHPESGTKSVGVQKTATGTGISSSACPRVEPPPAHPHHQRCSHSKMKSDEGSPGLATRR